MRAEYTCTCDQYYCNLHTQFSRPVSSASQNGYPLPPTLLITGQPVVILDESIVAMVMGRDPCRPHPSWMPSPRRNLPAPVLQPRHAAGHLSQTPALNRSTVVYNSKECSVNTSETDVALVPSSPNSLPDGGCLVPGGPPLRPLPHHSPTIAEVEVPCSDHQVDKQYDPHTDLESATLYEIVEPNPLKGEGTDIPPPKDMLLPMTNSPGSSVPEQNDSAITIGDKILCTLAEGIVAIGQNNHGHQSLGYTGSDGESLQSLRAAVSTVFCEGKEELCIDSDSEIEEADSMIASSSCPENPALTYSAAVCSPPSEAHSVSRSMLTAMDGGIPYHTTSTEPPHKKQKVEFSAMYRRECCGSSPSLVICPGDLSSTEHVPVEGTASALESRTDLDYTHEVHEDADDGSATVNQALPTEAARQHAMVPVLCKEEEEQDEEDGSSGGAGGMDTHESSLRQLTIGLDKHSTANQLPDCRSGSAVVALNSLQQVPQTSLEMCLQSQTQGEGLHVPYLEEVNIDTLDGPTVLGMATASIDARRNMLAETAELRSTERPQWKGLYSSLVERYILGAQLQTGSDLMATTRLNLSRPRLRLGLSKRHKCTPLHHTQ